MHVLPVDILYTAFRFTFRYMASAAFANGKVWVGLDNQAHDAHSHNYVHDRIIMLKLENFEI